MIREIRKKMVILGNRTFSDAAKSYFGDTEKKDWVSRNMILEGSQMERTHIEALLCGNFILEATVADHVMAERLEKLLEKMRENSYRGWSLDLAMLREFRNILDGEKEGSIPEYRRKNLMLAEYDYMAKMPAEIPSAMQELQLYILRQADVPEGSREAFEAAVKIHNTIIEIMPYGQEDKVLARAAMLYFLMLKGYPAVLPELKETEYNELFFRYLQIGSAWAFEEKLIEAILARLELMIQLTAY